MAAVALGIEVVDHDEHGFAAWEFDLAFEAVAAEQGVAGEGEVFEVALGSRESVAGSGHEADFDAAAVVSVDQFDVPVGPVAAELLDAGFQHVVVEAVEGDAVFGLDHGEDVGVYSGDHGGGVSDRGLIDGLSAKLKPSDPV